jgi:aspartate aminotransferase-like enzyme
MDEQTISLGGTQAQYFRTPEFSRLMLECAAMLKTALDAPDDARMIFLTASGTGAMEAAVMNFFTPRDKVLVISGGTFGQRFRRICEIHEIPAEVIELRWDEAFKPEMLERYENGGITGMLVNMCETSTGQLYPMEVFSGFCKRNGVCLVVDAISSFLCDPFSMKKTNADAVIVSSQKGLALHPGMSFVAVRKETFEKRVVNNGVKSLYFNFNDYYPEILRGQTEFTPAIGIINELNDKLKRILAMGTNSYVEHCFFLSDYFRKCLESVQYLSSVHYPLSNCVTPVLCTKKNAQKIVASLRDKHDIYVVPAAGDLADSMFRVAHMSRRLSEKDIDQLIALLRRYGEQK